MFDTNLKSVFEEREKIKSGVLASIAFADLWHLFEPGVEIKSTQGMLQVYCVLSIVGGRPFLCTKYEAGTISYRDREADEWVKESADMYRISPKSNSFAAQAFQYYFDGTSIGLVDKRFTIQPYEGRRLITSLPCYPNKFAKGVEVLEHYRHELIERGRRFVSIATDIEKIHYRCSGLTLDGEVREEVNLASYCTQMVDACIRWLT